MNVNTSVYLADAPLREGDRSVLQRAAEAVVVARRQLPFGSEAEVEEYALMVMKKEIDVDPQPMDSVNQSMVDAAVDSVVQLVTATLKSKSLAKFAEAARLCQIGQQLMRTQAKGVKEFAMLEVDEPEIINLGDEIVGNRYVGGGGAEERRERLIGEPLAQVERERAAAEIATNEAAELDRLTGMRDRLPENQRGPIDARIAVLVTSLETRNNARVQMVSADVSRGHSAGAEGAEDHDSAGVRADAGRGEGTNGVALAGHQIAAGAQAMG